MNEAEQMKVIYGRVRWLHRQLDRGDEAPLQRKSLSKTQKGSVLTNNQELK